VASVLGKPLCILSARAGVKALVDVNMTRKELIENSPLDSQMVTSQ
jgi:hypothetical protein